MIYYYETDAKDLDIIEDMWKNLICHLQSKSTYFSSDYKQRVFEERKKQFIEISKNGQLRLDIVKDEKKYVGYCVSSIINGKGAVDSIYVDNDYRENGIGRKLIELVLGWMEFNGVLDIEILITFGNEEALAFYENFGFHPKNMLLHKKF